MSTLPSPCLSDSETGFRSYLPTTSSLNLCGQGRRLGRATDVHRHQPHTNDTRHVDPRLTQDHPLLIQKREETESRSSGHFSDPTRIKPYWYLSWTWRVTTFGGGKEGHLGNDRSLVVAGGRPRRDGPAPGEEVSVPDLL